MSILSTVQYFPRYGPRRHGQFFLEGKLEGDPTRQYRSTIWPRLRSRYRNGSGDMIAGPFGHGQ